MFREYRLLLPHIRRYRASYVLGVLCVLLAIFLKFLIPRFIGSSIDALRQSFEEGGGVPDAVWRNGLLIAGTAVLVALVRTTSRLHLLGTSRQSVHDLREALFAHLVKLSPSFYVRHQTGDIMSRSVNDARNVQGLLGPVFMYLTETGAIYLFGLTMMLRVDPLLTVVAVLPFPFFIDRARRLARVIQEGSRAAQEGLADVSAKVDESLSGQMVIKTLTLEEFDEARFREDAEEYRRLNLEVTRSRARLIPMMSALGTVCTLILFAVGGPRVVSGTISLGDFVAMNFYLQLIAGPSNTLGFVMSSLQRGAAALGRLREVFEMEPTLVDPPEPVDVDVHGALSVRHLTVAFPPLEQQPHLSGALPPASLVGGHGADGDANGGGRVVLQDVSFEVAAGQTVGVVGHTGAGKSILLQALARQLEIEPGQVIVDGVDVTRMRPSELRANIGFVPQDGFLFSAPLRDNVALARPDAPEEVVEAAVEAAQLSVDLPWLPKGLDTLVGERGVNLSGGQRQRAALARALVRDPQILMLDDSLSAVDTHTSDEILRRLRPWMRGRTTLLVAHRVATVQDADLILVLHEGRIVERGTHAELLARGGRYAALHERQQLRQTLAEELGEELTEDEDEA